MALPKVKIDTTEARLNALSLPAAAGWTQTARQDALSRVTEMGLPIKRDEYWRYTDPTALTSVEPVAASVYASENGDVFGSTECLHVVFVDGVFDAEASDELALDGVTIERLADSQSADIHWAKDLFGALETAGQTPVQRPLATLNTAFATDGLIIRATGKVAKPIHVSYLQTKTDSDAILRHLVQVDAGAEVTLLESGPAAARFNIVTEVSVADTASFHHVRAQGRDHERRAATAIFARLGAESAFKSFTMTANGVMTRNEVVIELTGDDSIAHVAGVCIGAGRDFHHDDTVFITHDAERCESRQVFKKVLRDNATGVFQGKILVKEGAQKTDGYQISQGLLLDDDSNFLAKPELESYADDVACSHGSTCGAIDETAIYYLRSRGVPKAEATDLLTLAFLAEALDEIDDETIAETLRDRLAIWLERPQG